MPLSNDLRARWQHVLGLLETHDAPFLAAVAKHGAWSSDEELEAFLVSNELWGGAGSIADSAAGADRAPGRLAIERALVELGTEQMRVGKVNPRTASWVHTFRTWHASGI